MSARGDPGRPGTVAVMGLGEAGQVIASDLVATASEVRGYDPAPVEPPPGVSMAARPADAVRGADVVLVLVPSRFAEEVANSSRPGLGPGTLYADCCTSGPACKRKIAELVEAAGAVFVDVALLAPVPGRGLAIPALLAGAGTERFVQLFSSFGLSAEIVSTVPGDAATRKLLRSVFMKGLAGVILEALEAARISGCEQWLRDNIVAELEQADSALVERLVTGTPLHARRRVDEMAEAEQLLAELSVNAELTRATKSRLEKLA
jgi:3-hydroxyisobutyrate dehydrogenase-like beta-hydroxyacid dehydrogenase